MTEVHKDMSYGEIAQELEKRGIKLYYDGCGCCNSPWARLEIDGITVIDAAIGEEHLSSNNGFSSWKELAPPPPKKDPTNDHRPKIDTEAWERYGQDKSPVGTQYSEPPSSPDAYRPGD